MAATRPAKAAEPEVEAPVSIFDEIRVATKAGTFRFREIDGEQYDKCVELSTNDKTEMVNTVQLLRWLAIKSAVGDGALDAGTLNKLPYKARNKVLAEVNTLYFPDDVEEMAQQLRRAGWTVTAPKEEDSGNA